MSTLSNLFRGRMLIVASSSPRRHQLISGLDIPFKIEIPEEYDESYDQLEQSENIPLILAKMKSDNFGRPLRNEDILLTADTMVFCNGKIMGKPDNTKEAIDMLSFLSGRMHTVVTGVHLKSNRGEKSFSVSTNVYFKDLSYEEIHYYVENYKPFDKAGAYGAQEWIGYVAIDKIEGSYFNVMGLPVHSLYSELCNFIQSGC